MSARPVSPSPARRRRTGALAALAGLAALALRAAAWAPADPARHDAARRGEARRARELDDLGGGFFNKATKGVQRHGKAGGMSVSVLWKNLSYTAFLPVTLTVDNVERKTVLRPRAEMLRMAGAAHFVSGDYRRYPDFIWTVNAAGPSAAHFLTCATSPRAAAARPTGPEGATRSRPPMRPPWRRAAAPDAAPPAHPMATARP